jgi:hypothetical protein
MWGTLSDKRTGLSFTIAASPQQCSHFWVWVPWYLWSYFTVSDLRLPFLSPPTTHRATVEVFSSISTWNELPGWCPCYINPLHRPSRKHYFQQYLYCCMHIHCHANMSTEPFPSNSRLFLLIKNLLSSSECCFIVCFEATAQQWLYMLQYCQMVGRWINWKEFGGKLHGLIEVLHKIFVWLD